MKYGVFCVWPHSLTVMLVSFIRVDACVWSLLLSLSEIVFGCIKYTTVCLSIRQLTSLEPLFYYAIMNKASMKILTQIVL